MGGCEGEQGGGGEAPPPPVLPRDQLQSVVMLRHGRRLDSVNPSSKVVAKIPWDPPLAPRGVSEVRGKGRWVSGLGWKVGLWWKGGRGEGIPEQNNHG